MGSNESKLSNYHNRHIESNSQNKTTHEENSSKHKNSHDRRGIRFHRRGTSKGLTNNQIETQQSPAQFQPPLSSASSSAAPAVAAAPITSARGKHDSPKSHKSRNQITSQGRRPSLKKGRHSTNFLTIIKHPHASIRKSLSSGSESGESTDTNKTSSSLERVNNSSVGYPADDGSAAMISAVANAMAASTPSLGGRTSSNGAASTDTARPRSTSNEPVSSNYSNKNSNGDTNDQRSIEDAATLLHPSDSQQMFSVKKKEEKQQRIERDSEINHTSERLLKELYLLPESDSRRRKERDR
ncbi:hypothetical protein INT45_006985 [Circinella minor]|uniref:Uncharacterized protein n=1 Tax=Circinella minor TaxID=1195481 RepID=A0A8H7S487_9FUNG|nr:hypothetical protein INT45_006985 [Circinella minor]